MTDKTDFGIWILNVSKIYINHLIFWKCILSIKKRQYALLNALYCKMAKIFE